LHGKKRSITSNRTSARLGEPTTSKVKARDAITVNNTIMSHSITENSPIDPIANRLMLIRMHIQLAIRSPEIDNTSLEKSMTVKNSKRLIINEGFINETRS
jgi:hypothetical protein